MENDECTPHIFLNISNPKINFIWETVDTYIGDTKSPKANMFPAKCKRCREFLIKVNIKQFILRLNR